jgi:hypothetical protein
LVAAIALVVGCSVFVGRQVARSRAPGDPEAGLSDAARGSLHATAEAVSGDLVRENAISFAQSGRSLDSLPRAEIQSITGIATHDLQVATESADSVVIARSEGAFVDPDTGKLRLRLTVVNAIKDGNTETVDVTLTGGPRVAPDGSWVLALAPGELYLAKGDRAFFTLSRNKIDGELRQRPYEAMLVRNGKFVVTDESAFRSLDGRSVEQVTTTLRGAIR